MSPSNPRPPVARRVEHVREHFGVRLEDPYAWLRDPAYPEVRDGAIRAHLEAENAYWEAMTAHLRGFEQELFEELKGRIEEEDSSVPVREGGFEYRWRYAKGAQYRIWERRPLGQESFRPILDENRLAAGLDYFDLRALAVSPDGRLLAYGVDTDGSERYELRVRDLESGEELPFRIPHTTGVPVWVEEGRSLAWVELDERLRPHRALVCRLARPEERRVLHEEPDPAFFVGLTRTRSRRLLLVTSGTHVTRETRLFDARTLEGGAPVVPRREGHDYRVDHAHGRLWILTNDRHRNFRLVCAPEADPREGNWEEVIAPSDEVYLLDHACFSEVIAIEERYQGVDRIRIRHYDGREHHVDFGEELYAAGLGDNREFATDRLRLHFSSLLTPATVYDYVLAERRLVVRKVQRIPRGYDRDAFVAERLWAVSRDGVRVPLSLVRPRNLPRDRRRPVLLYGYGAYGHGLVPAFSPHRLGLLERGVAFAIAHVRGGDELGYGWYEDGKLLRKWNTFHDFIACAEALCHAGWTVPGRIACQGGSAGGMLIGVVVNERPDLWAAAVLQVPFVDVLNTMMDPSLPLTPIEWPEWGNPLADETAFRYILSYSPYDNIRRQPYPPMLVTAGLHDPRVTYWEPAKYVAKLRALRTDDRPLLLRTEMGAGHFGPSGRFEHLRELARIQAFVLDRFGLAPASEG